MSRTVAVILNHATADETVRAVRSLMQATSPVAEIIVVDNGSGDRSVDRISRSEPAIRMIESRENRGFSAGCNLGIRAALERGADAVLLLNSDVVVPPETVAGLELALASNPEIGIVAPMIVTMSDPTEVQSLGIRYSARTGRMRHRGYGERMERLERLSYREVDGVSGCAMLVRREVLARVGLLTEEYFFGFEDLDFCLRARAAGYRSACVETVSVLHQGSLSIGRGSPRRIYFAVRNHLLLATRMRPQSTAPERWLRSVTIIALNLAHALMQREVPRGSGLRALVKGVRDFRAGRFGAGPATASV